MRFYQKYSAYSPDINCPPFPASVPGNVQLDYITAHPEFVSDVNYGMEHKKMVQLEPYTWFYKTTLDFVRNDDEKLWFVTEGIDYIWTLILDGKEFYTHEGMFTRVDICLDDVSEELFGHPLEKGMEFCIKIHPHPMLEGMPMDRNQAAQCCKPPVAYEWDWHPRVIPSGLWDECYIESRDDNYIGRTEARYSLEKDFSSAKLTITSDVKKAAEVNVYAPNGEVVAHGTTVNGVFETVVDSPLLWWCNGYGEPNLYKYTVKLGENTVEKYVGFRRIELTMNTGRFVEPQKFPKSRAYPPAQLTLNGINVFAKGSNYVNQDIFTGTLTREKYEENIRFAHAANMNILRCWGGTGCQKEEFYSLCDQYGIMIWFEFPLACNDYYDSVDYLTTLKQEATAIVLKLRSHPCISIWCGGNELFNSWSGMTDQRLALRLLNSITLELAPEIPYNPTSPIWGMKHGGYTFLDPTTGVDQFTLFSSTEATAYTEFGIPSTPSADYLRSFIPEDELFPPKPGGVWQAHHAFWAWNGEEAWLCLKTLDRFGDISSLEALVETSNWLQQVGYKAIFEEARRQKPLCAMAINWCWCEPWKCAANNSLIAYPNIIKPGYYAVKDSLRNITPSARFTKFSWDAGQPCVFETWLLNDGKISSCGTITATVELDGVKYFVGIDNISTEANQNTKGQTHSFEIPANIAPKTRMKVALVYESDNGEVIENSYDMVVGA